MRKKCCAVFDIIAVILLFLLCGCGTTEPETGIGNGWTPERSMELQFATQFSVDYYEGGYKLISLADGSRFLVVPEGFAVFSVLFVWKVSASLEQRSGRKRDVMKL